MLKPVINQYGASKQALSDDGSAFRSEDMREFITLVAGNGVTWGNFQLKLEKNPS